MTEPIKNCPFCGHPMSVPRHDTSIGPIVDGALIVKCEVQLPGTVEAVQLDYRAVWDDGNPPVSPRR